MTETVSGATTRKGKAAQPSRNKLKMRRIHTTPGVHPYDQVTWERRDVVMTNLRDGTVNFEQHGVEFPDFWSVNAANIVTTKYFRGAVGSPQREWSLKQLYRPGCRHLREGGQGARLLRHRRGRRDLRARAALRPGPPDLQLQLPGLVQRRHRSPRSRCPRASSWPWTTPWTPILDWYREEGLIFKGGSGAGVNLSKIRSSKELLSSGGTASGPVSFMRGADASAGTIKSGGATRRAAKMVVLDVDHPDIAEFIETKAREEDKVPSPSRRRVRHGPGRQGHRQRPVPERQQLGPGLRRVHARGGGGREFDLLARRTGEVIERIDARKLIRRHGAGRRECADPGIQYDGTINDWHTNPESGRITASNPCFPADQRVATDKGLIRIGDMVRRAANEEQFAVYTNDVTAEADPQDRVIATSPTRYMVTGRNEILELRFSDGARLRCTPGHRIWTANRGWVAPPNN